MLKHLTWGIWLHMWLQWPCLQPSSQAVMAINKSATCGCSLGTFHLTHPDWKALRRLFLKVLKPTVSWYWSQFTDKLCGTIGTQDTRESHNFPQSLLEWVCVTRLHIGGKTTRKLLMGTSPVCGKDLTELSFVQKRSTSPWSKVTKYFYSSTVNLS